MFNFLRNKNKQDLPDDQPEPSVREALLAERPSDILWNWAQRGILPEVLPDLEVLRGVSQLPAHRDNAFIHTLKVVDAIEPTPVRRAPRDVQRVSPPGWGDRAASSAAARKRSSRAR